MNDDVTDNLSRWAIAHDVSESALAELRRLLDDPSSAWVAALGISGAWSTQQSDRASPAARPLPSPSGGEHLQHLEPLGAGGMGEVVRAHDARLQREVALKILQRGHAGSEDFRARFVAEATAQAQLAHPGIVPVHEMGVLGDGRPFFTMQINRGRTLHEVIRDLHGSPPEASDVPLRRVVEMVRRACEVVAFAHSRGVVHRDLKPANIMVGAFGEVQVIDWGLVHTEGTVDGVAGTPGYMAPEQTHGGVVDARTDVFALGRVLQDVAGEGASDDLVAISRRAMHADPQQRFDDANSLAGALSDWLDGVARRAHAMRFVEEAVRLEPEARALRVQAQEHEAAATALDAHVPPSASLEEKDALWHEQDEAQRCNAEADAAQRTRIDRLLQALSHDPDNPEAKRSLARWYRDRLAQAEASGDAAGADSATARLQHYDDGTHAAFLTGTGAVTLVTDPPGAEVDLYRYDLVQRRLVPRFERSLGTTPLRAEPLERGSWLLIVQAEGHEPVHYPVFLRRQEHWDGVAPGGSEPHPVVLPALGTLGPTDRYVAAGWFHFGLDDAPHQAWPAERRWLDAIVMRTFAVTNREYVAFLDSLVAGGQEELAHQCVPRAQRAQGDDRIDPVYARHEDGSHHLVPDGDGDLWDPHWPVIQIPWSAARHYADWEAQRTGSGWRLPHEEEWEKAARGVDGRAYPWGDRFDSTFALVRTSFPDRPTLAPVQHFPGDTSVYGVRGMAGGVRDWCLDRFARPGTALPDSGEPGERLLRGGCWHFSAAAGRTTARARLYQERVSDLIGFRLVRKVEP